MKRHRLSEYRAALLDGNQPNYDRRPGRRAWAVVRGQAGCAKTREPGRHESADIPDADGDASEGQDYGDDEDDLDLIKGMKFSFDARRAETPGQ